MADTRKVADNIPQELLRYMHVEPAEFKAVKTRLGLTNQEAATAIGRTLSRVSELTNSKGASQAIYDRVVPLWEAAAEAKAQAKAAEQTEA